MKKKYFCCAIALLLMLLLASCNLFKEEEIEVANPVLSSIRFNKYSKFLLKQEVTTSKAASDSLKSLYGLNVGTNEYEKITFVSELNQEYQLYDITKIGSRYLYLPLWYQGVQKTYIVDVKNNKVFDVGAFVDSKTTGTSQPVFFSNSVYQIDEGLAFTLGGVLYVLNVDTNQIIPRSNILSDTFHDDNYYISPNGNAILGSNGKLKFFSADGSMPIYLNYSMYCSFLDCTTMICSETANYIADLQNKRLIRFSNEGLTFEDIQYDGTIYGRPLYPTKTSKNQPNYYGISDFKSGQIKYYLESTNSIVSAKIINGELSITSKELPTTLKNSLQNAKMALLENFLIYEDENKFLSYVDIENSEIMEICSSRTADWEVSGLSIVYSKYITPTSVETFQYDMLNKITTKLSSSQLPDIKLVSF